MYVWDPEVRRFVEGEEAGGDAQPPAYAAEDMVYEGDDEVIPAYEAPPRVNSAQTLSLRYC